MKRRALPTITAMALILIVVLAAVAIAQPRNVTTKLSGAQEVADEPVETRAHGTSKVQLSKDGTELEYWINVAQIENITMAHIHLGPRGENGPVVAWLYPDGPPAQLMPGRSNGRFAAGTLTDDDLVGPMAGGEIADLWEAIRAGNAYVNVHTSQFPAGEIRGQLEMPGRHGH
jgi:hypothetical protein